VLLANYSLFWENVTNILKIFIKIFFYIFEERKILLEHGGFLLQDNFEKMILEWILKTFAFKTEKNQASNLQK